MIGPRRQCWPPAAKRPSTWPLSSIMALSIAVLVLPLLRRIPSVRGLVDSKAYFVLHAPRQMGKTTALLTMARALTGEGKYLAAMLSMETGAPYGQDVGLAEGAILTDWARTAAWQLPKELQPPQWPAAPPGSGIAVALGAWVAAAPRPLVVFLDEIDALHDKIGRAHV